jgi:hypothetical protein
MCFVFFRLLDYLVWFPVRFPFIGHPSPGNGSPTSIILGDSRFEAKSVWLPSAVPVWRELLVVAVVAMIVEQTMAQINRTFAIFKFIFTSPLSVFSAMSLKIEKNKKSVKRKESESKNRNLRPTLYLA